MPAPRFRVLVVDDERIIADTLGVILREAGYDVDVVYSGTAGVERARATRPNLVLSDVIMPDLDGVEMCIRIRSEIPDCNILLFSGQASTADLLLDARRRGYTFHIVSKPVHPQDLIQMIRKSAQSVSLPPQDTTLLA